MTTSRLPILSLLETRVLGVLCEKQHTVPDTYPLSLNALVAGCNQKTSRHPIIDASEAEVQAALDSLRGPALVIESSGGRVPRYAHNLGKALQLPAQAVALLTVLMLRGPQTAGELRINCERLHKFADISAVEGFLHELAGTPRRRDGGRTTPPARLRARTAGRICSAAPPPSRKPRPRRPRAPNPWPTWPWARSPRSRPTWHDWRPK